MESLEMKICTQSPSYNDGKPVHSVFRFELVPSACFQYGNGKALDVYRDGDFWKNYDVRYVSVKPFEKLCRQVLKDYFGENLKTAEVI